MVVQVDLVELVADEHAAHDVAPGTEGHPASHPLLASLSSLNLLAEHEAIEVQVDALEVAADEHAAHDVTPGSTEGHPASHPLLA